MVCYNRYVKPGNCMQPSSSEENKNSNMIIFTVIMVVLLIALITGIVLLSKSKPETTGQVRDIFIIILAFESLLIGAALIILILQIAVLTNLIQNEVKPIIASTKETVSTLKGTSTFISKRAVMPIISVSSYLAGAKKLLELIGFIRKK